MKLQWQPQGASRRLNRHSGPSGGRAPGGCGPPNVSPSSLELRLCRLLDSSCRTLIGSRMDDGWMECFVLFSFSCFVLMTLNFLILLPFFLTFGINGFAPPHCYAVVIEALLVGLGKLFIG